MDEVNISSINDIEAMSGSGVSYLLQQANDVRSQRVNWQAYLQCDLITKEHFNLVSSIDKAPNFEARTQIINQDEDMVAKVFLFLLNKLSKEQALQYTLTMIDDLLQEDKSRANIFRNYFIKRGESLWPHFFGFLSRNDAFSMYQASRIITKIACWSSLRMEKNDLEFFFNWIKGQLLMKDNRYASTVARNLQMLLRIPQYRTIFHEMNGIDMMAEVLELKAQEAQLCYQIIFCLWVLSFDSDCALKIFKVGLLIPSVADIFSDCDKEKILRISAALFRSVLEKILDTQNSQDIRNCSLTLVQCKVLRRVELLMTKDYSHDKELADDLQFLQDKLSNSVNDVSSLEEYTAELQSGRLDWSPVHKSQKFWREHAANFTDRNYELLKMLIHLLKTSQEGLIISVAAHDIGEFVRHYPRGKQVIEQLGAKVLVMGLLEHEDPNVRYNALVSVQKIMLHNWEHMGRQLEDPAASGGPRSK
ncbi:hypothetical protein Ciccas_005984 [Cichlidogyrus casuarinus]|uniref:V-type proton ATPase subunit H n=1 Tax=Cichlidogyrus casuarinus TaxID=1844966 RepID=A0ABD2Q759_9PLAT